MLRITHILIFIVAVTSKLQAQSLNFRCNGKFVAVESHLYGGPLQACDYVRYGYNSLDSINKSDSIIIENIKKTIEARGSSDFYNNLLLYEVGIVKSPDGCQGIKYSLRFGFSTSEIFDYRPMFWSDFSITYDVNGNQLSENEFPDVATNQNILNFIDYCKALEIALNDIAFKKAVDNNQISRYKENENGKKEKLLNIESINLVYDQSRNIWTWVILSDSEFNYKIGGNEREAGLCTGKKITINAHNATVLSLENYEVYKSLLFSR